MYEKQSKMVFGKRGAVSLMVDLTLASAKFFAQISICTKMDILGFDEFLHVLFAPDSFLQPFSFCEREAAIKRIVNEQVIWRKSKS